MKHILCHVILIALFSSFTCHAQKIEDFSLKHAMKQDGLALQFTVLDPDKKGIRRYETDKIYYWYKAQKVMGTQGGSSGQLLHGAYEAFYLSKQLCEKGCYVKGLKDGEWHYWRTDGSLIRTEHWKNGTQRGEQIDYSAKGDVQKRTIIRGRRTTMSSGDTLVEISRHSRTVTLMDSTGSTRSVARYRNGLLHGKQETIASDGTTTTVAYKNGVAVEAKPKKEKQPQEGDTEKKPFKERIKQRFKKEKTAEEQPSNTEKPKKERKKTGKHAETPTPATEENPDAKKGKKFNPFKRKSA